MRYGRGFAWGEELIVDDDPLVVIGAAVVHYM